MLSDEDKKALVGIARGSLERYLKGERFEAPKDLPEHFKEPRGAFVTLHKQGALRGCIGHIRAVKPLWEAVAELAVEAAVHDPRFPPVRLDELRQIDFEISVLTPLERIDDPAKVEVGTHGLMTRRGSWSGLLLPQVATEYGWDRETFLEQTCYKAGLPRDAWRQPDTELFVFSAIVFGERSLGLRA